VGDFSKLIARLIEQGEGLWAAFDGAGFPAVGALGHPVASDDLQEFIAFGGRQSAGSDQGQDQDFKALVGIEVLPVPRPVPKRDETRARPRGRAERGSVERGAWSVRAERSRMAEFVPELVGADRIQILGQDWQDGEWIGTLVSRWDGQKDETPQPRPRTKDSRPPEARSPLILTFSLQGRRESETSLRPARSTTHGQPGRLHRHTRLQRRRPAPD